MITHCSSDSTKFYFGRLKRVATKCKKKHRAIQVASVFDFLLAGSVVSESSAFSMRRSSLCAFSLRSKADTQSSISWSIAALILSAVDQKLVPQSLGVSPFFALSCISSITFETALIACFIRENSVAFFSSSASAAASLFLAESIVTQEIVARAEII